MVVTKFQNTDTGRKHTTNEDLAILENVFDDDDLLAVVIDGVGGYEGGEIAARIAHDAIIDYLKTYPNGERLSLLKEAVNEANNKIFRERKTMPRYSSMSCVLTACIVEFSKKRFHIAHIGDTRLYLIANAEFKKLTRDHSLIGYREEVGNLTEIEAMNHLQRNIISRDLGSQQHNINDEDFIETNSFDLPDNAALLLCSDGLHDMLTSAEIIEVLNKNNSTETRVNGLIAAANEKGGRDNITAVLIEWSPDYAVKSVNTFIQTAEAEEPAVFEEQAATNNILLHELPKDEKIPPSYSYSSRFSNTWKWILVVVLSFLGGWLTHQYLGEKLRTYFLPRVPKNHVLQPQPQVFIDTSIQLQLNTFFSGSAKDTFTFPGDSIYLTKELVIRNNGTIWIQKKPLFIINKGDFNLRGIVIMADSCIIKNIHFIGFRDSIYNMGKNNTIR